MINNDLYYFQLLVVTELICLYALVMDIVMLNHKIVSFILNY